MPQGGATRPHSECSDFPQCAKRILAAIAASTIGLRAAARNAIPKRACLLRRSSHLETRQTAGSASLSRPASGRVRPRGLHAHAFAESLRTLNRKGQRSGIRVFTESSQLYL